MANDRGARRQQLSARAHRAVQREGLSHVGGHAARGDRTRRAWAGAESYRGEEERRAGDATRVVRAWKYADDLPSVVRPSDGDRAVHGRGRDDSAAKVAA